MTTCKKCKSNNATRHSSYNYFDTFECINCENWTYERIDDCCRTPYYVVVIEHFFKNNSPISSTRIFKQCLNCGYADRSKCLDLKTYDNDIEREFNSTKFADRLTSKFEEQKILKEQYQFYKNSLRYKYHLYLLSPQWKDKRDEVIKRDGGICRHCKLRTADEVHHLHYDTIYKETLDDLISVCSNCHRDLHKNVFSSVLKDQ